MVLEVIARKITAKILKEVNSIFKSYKKAKRTMNKVTKPMRDTKRVVNKVKKPVKKVERSVNKVNKRAKSIEKENKKRIEREIAIKTKPIENMDGLDFEDYLAKLYKDLGYKVTRTSDTGDFGADLILTKQGERTIIQAKRYSSKVGIRAVQEISSAQKYYKADSMAVVTNNLFTNAAQELALINGVTLIDGKQLMNMVSKRDRNNEEKQKSVQPVKPVRPMQKKNFLERLLGL